MIKVVVCGGAGRMGREVVRVVQADPDLDLVGAVDPSAVGSDVGTLAGIGSLGISISPDLLTTLRKTSAEVMVDFTHPSVVMENIRTAMKSGVHAVVGTTGITQDNIQEIKTLLKGKTSNVFIAPNFAIGAVLMMEFAKQACRYFPKVEIIELHHEQKADAPSGTSLKTAEDLSQQIQEKSIADTQEKELIEGVRGGKVGRVRIHSLRLPGLVAHQEVIFGGAGQTLKIRHDSLDRSSFMPGVIMAVKEVSKRPGLTYGLEKILDLGRET